MGSLKKGGRWVAPNCVVMGIDYIAVLVFVVQELGVNDLVLRLRVWTTICEIAILALYNEERHDHRKNTRHDILIPSCVQAKLFVK
jgi:hypothetical protein